MSWILLTIVGATIQSFRNLEQKNLNKKLDSLTVSWSRFILPLPIAILVVIFTYKKVSFEFVYYAIFTSIFQILGNLCLLKTVKSKNFSIGILFSKTEVLQSAVIGALLFNQTISSYGYFAIFIMTIGIFLMSEISFSYKKFDKVWLFGILSGTCFGFAGFGVNLTSKNFLETNHSTFFISAMITLLWVILMQNLIIASIKIYKKSIKNDFINLLSSENRKSFFLTSCLSFIGSVFWFSALSIAGSVIYVKAVGQFELIVAGIISHFHLREKHKIKEIIGAIMISFAILLVIIFH